MYEPKTALNRATRLIPNLQTGLIQNASHMLNSDQPEEVDDRVLKFLAKDKCEA
jgi:pimeloyl-ACP methyl ester carboxylesterase